MIAYSQNKRYAIITGGHPKDILKDLETKDMEHYEVVNMFWFGIVVVLLKRKEIK